ncbi:flagellar M-ring protein FliF [Nocardioides ginsengisegetis]|uniref:Flagellar M-ring protein n=1 Tax=Nocardioides ginsengisegetis TaxID=661491 RepID=A0A7W3J2G9_9ACTN|nr:flagellar basal-body MS-ring/collar protein FliF [Nocardioides ginsengisegetis]MBA8805012.1 flagellar M-ring protein FliF [Nocardioides ginsengisegetis]
MKQNLSRSLARVRDSFLAFTTGQKVVAIIGGAAVLLAALMVFRWAATPNYAPLFSNLASSDASAVIDELDAEGVPYELANNGSTVMVPKDQVYATRIALSGKGLPGNSGDSGGGYSLLDNQSISTSQFQEQTDFKRAMEGELAKTIEAMDGVDAAIVHLALPPAKVFADQQDPPTASVMLDTSAGTTFTPEQVQSVVHLVASSIDGLTPENVTVADAQGRMLSSSDAAGLGASSRDQQLTDFQNQMSAKVQSVLDRVLGPGNSTVQVTADLDFDKAVQDTTTYTTDPTAVPLSSSSQTETYAGPGGGSGSTGVVGPDGQMGPGVGATGGSGSSSYKKESVTEDNAVGTVVEHRETAPGSINSLHAAVVLDTAAARMINPSDVEKMVAAAMGIDKKRGDTLDVSTMAFDRTADNAAAAELAAAKAAEKKANDMAMFRNIGIAVAIALAVLLAWLRGRRRAKQREDATTYLVEQLRQDAARRTTTTAAVETSPALAALERSENNAADEMRRELADLVERQPEDVAALLRGWLVERP